MVQRASFSNAPIAAL